MDTRYELWQTGGNGGYKMLVGTYNTWNEAFDVAKERNEECNDEGNYWAELDYFIIVEEGLTPHKLKCALNFNSNSYGTMNNFASCRSRLRIMYRELCSSH